MKKEEKTLDVVFLLDKSGSMHNASEDTIGGYNSFLKDEKVKNSKITTILFSDNTKTITYRKPISEVKELTEKDYKASGCTALYDAIGKTINKLDKEKDIKKVLFVITTDGYENASNDFHKKDISNLIKKHPNYEFIYLGADIDSYSESSALGISQKNSANYSKDNIKGVFKSVSRLYECITNDEEIDEDWKSEL